jgi:hypothetical protein
MITKEKFQAIAELDLNPIKVKLMHKESGEGWTLEYANMIEFEYRRFLYLVKAYPNENIAPMSDVDVFWHYHILDTMKYAADCDSTFGYFLHHFPYVGLDDDDAPTRERVGLRMQALYQMNFGEPYGHAGTAEQQTGATANCYEGSSDAASVRQVAAYCYVNKPIRTASGDAAYCYVTKPAGGVSQASAYCYTDNKAGASAQQASYCYVANQHRASAQEPAYCYVAKPAGAAAREAAYCYVEKPRDTGAQKAAYCYVTKPGDASAQRSAYCYVTSPAGVSAQGTGYCYVTQPANGRSRQDVEYSTLVT